MSNYEIAYWVLLLCFSIMVFILYIGMLTNAAKLHKRANSIMENALVHLENCKKHEEELFEIKADGLALSMLMKNHNEKLENRLKELSVQPDKQG